MRILDKINKLPEWIQYTSLILTFAYFLSVESKQEEFWEAKMAMNGSPEVIELKQQIGDVKESLGVAYRLKYGIQFYKNNNYNGPVPEKYDNSAHKTLDSLYRKNIENVLPLEARNESTIDSLTFVRDSLEQALESHPLVKDFDQILIDQYIPFK